MTDGTSIKFFHEVACSLAMIDIRLLADPLIRLNQVPAWGGWEPPIQFIDVNVGLRALTASSFTPESPLQTVAMAVLPSCGRALSKSLIPRSGHLLTRLTTAYPTIRVSSTNGRDSSSDPSQTSLPRSFVTRLPIRTYATATGRPVGRPKAHTGRTAAKRTTTTTKSAGTKTAAPKKAAAKSKPKKTVKAKAKPKAKLKKRALTEAGVARKEAIERVELRKKALLTGHPKRLPDTAWKVIFVENAPKKGSNFSLEGSHAKAASQVFQNLSLEEREVNFYSATGHMRTSTDLSQRANHTANTNRAKNETAHKNWVQSFTPLQIKEANNARDQLKREAKKNGDKHPRKYAHIKDDRLVKLPVNPYALFLQDRVASGDMNGMKIGEVGKLVAREFKDLDAAQRKV